jgi:hypothetical protein
MAADAGFAVALTIRERLFNDALLIAYTSGGFPSRLALQLPGKSGEPTAAIDFFLAPPQIACNIDGTLTIAVRMWGSLTVAFDGLEQAGVVDAQLTLEIQPSFVVADSKLALELDDADHDVSATEWGFTVISGSGFSPDAAAYLRSDPFRDRLQEVIRFAISTGHVQLPEIDISFLGEVLTAVDGMTAEALVVDGALMLGLDVDAKVGLERITTHGDVNQLSDFARDNDIAAVTSAAAVPLLLGAAYQEISKGVTNSGAALTSLTTTAAAGRLLVAGSATRSTGAATFSFAVIPTTLASRPGTLFQYLPKSLHVKPRSWPAIGFAVVDVDVDVDVDSWVDVVMAAALVLSLLLGSILADVIGSIVTSAAAHLADQLADANTPSPVAKVQHLKPVHPSEAAVRIDVADYEITTLGTYVGITFRPKAPPGALIGLTSIPSDLRTQTLSYSVRLPLGVLAGDPALRIRWTVLDSSGTVLANSDGIAESRENFALIPDDVGPGLSELLVTCRVYRPLGEQVTDFVNDAITLNVTGPLAAGAYVRWFYEVKNPQVRFEEGSDAWAYTGDSVVRRHSNLHRTDRPCKMAAKRSRFLYRIDFLDALPFPVAEIDAHRARLCDYCFYGGPGGDRPSL